MGTKPAPLGSGDRMWRRASRGAQGCACWVIGPAVPDGFNAALYQTVEVRILLDDGSGRNYAAQLDQARRAPAGRIVTVKRGQLVAFGTATWFRESRQAFQARQAALELEQLQASRRAAAEASQAETEARRVMDAAKLAWLKDPAAWDDFYHARQRHDTALRHSDALAMRLPIVHVLDEAGGYRHLTEAQAAHQHWLDEFARTAAALEATHGTQV